MCTSLMSTMRYQYVIFCYFCCSSGVCSVDCCAFRSLVVLRVVAMQFSCWFPVFLAYRTCWWIAPAGEKLSINTWSLAFLPLELSTNKLHAAFDSLFLSRYRACCPYDVYVQWLLYGSESRIVMYTFIYSNLHSHGYADATIHHQRTSKNTITLLKFPLYSFPHPITFSPGAAVAVAARILWVGLSCQSIRGR